jgi:hypothetical protein
VKHHLISRRARLLAAPALAILLSACTPGLNILNPGNGQTVSGVVSMDNDVTPDAQSGLDSVDANVDGTDIPLDENHDGQIDTNILTNGQHTVTANASNVDGTTSKSVTINVQNPPIPGSICLVGDSITFMAFYPHGETEDAPAELASTYGLGWRVQEVMSWVQDQVAHRGCKTFLSALAVNDVSPTHGGFTVDDQTRFTTLWDTPHTTSCKVQVLPFWGTGLTNQAHIDGMTAFRDWALLQDAAREDLVTIDWMPYVQANPWVMHTDGIHLAWADYTQPDGSVFHTTMLEAAEIRQNFYWSETTAACEAFIQAFEADPQEFLEAA